MKKIYAEPMTKVMKLNAASIMDTTITVSDPDKDKEQKAQPLELF